MQDKQPLLYNIPAGMPFAKTLARSLLKDVEGNPLALSRYCIFVPTRRSARSLQEAFLSLSPEKTLLLPRIQPIGDLDEEELFFNIQGFHQYSDQSVILPAMPVLEREILLTRLVQQKNPDAPLEQSLSLARALGHFIDQIYNENLSLDHLENLVPDKYAHHWQITLDFLKIISEFWPEILSEKGMIDYAQRRNKLILSLANFWEKSPPDYPVIAAGSTGSLPATAKLISIISRLPQGSVVLPGYDSELDGESWNELSATHPQFGFKALLETIGVSREIIQLWPGCENISNNSRHFFARELMRPSHTTSHWKTLSHSSESQNTISQACKDIDILYCQNENEEALCISLIIREALENPDTKICIVTPDKNISQRLQASARRWNITIDDSAGQTLDRSSIGQFFVLLYQAFMSGFEPVKLMALLKHPLSAFKNSLPEHSVETLDLALRGLKPSPGFKALKAHCEANQNISAKQKETALVLLSLLENILSPLIRCFENKSLNFSTILEAHIKSAQLLAASSEDKSGSILWSGEEGRAASAFLAELLSLQSLKSLNHKNLADSYGDTLLSFMQQKTVRPLLKSQPRVRILGLLEARMLDCDLVIMSGLNEGIWPSEPEPDPWMSRPMRSAFGLPSRERSIGLSAHDFVQCLCTQKVVITRSLKSGSAPSVPARWLQRMETVLKAAEMGNIPIINQHPALIWARTIDQSDFTPRAKRPAPCPPLDKRPQRLSVTRIETWLKDPYSIYARYILNLKKTDEMEKPLDAAEYGIILHKIIETFSQQYPDILPDNPLEELFQIARTELNKRDINPDEISFWWTKFRKIASWFINHENQWRSQSRLLKQEVKGEITIGDKDQNPFILFGYPDRIDLSDHGRAVIIDYKSGGTFSLKGMRNGDLPQLPLEALMLSKGGFAGIAPLKSQSLQYWIMHGRGSGGQITELKEDLDPIILELEKKLSELIRHYQNPDTCYPSIPYPEKAPVYNDYEHLARIQEWAVTADNLEETGG